MFEIANLLVKEVIKLAKFLTLGLKFSYKCGSLNFYSIESSGDRTSIAEISGIHMPSVVNLEGKDDIGFLVAGFFQLCVNVYRIGQLGLCRHKADHTYNNKEKSFHSYVISK